MPAKAEIDRYDMERLQRAAIDLSAVCRKSLSEIVIAQAMGFTSVAIKSTKIAPRSVLKTGYYSPDGTYYPWPEPRRIKPVGRGFARSGWVKSMRGLGVAGGDQYLSGKQQGLSFGYFDQSEGSDGLAVTVGNQIPYIDQLDPDEITRKGLKYATIRGEKAIESIGKRRAAQTWHKYGLG